MRHIERCVCLLYVIDASLPTPWEQLNVLRYELEQYNKELLTKPSAILANKMDLKEAEENLGDLKLYAERLNLPIFPLSAQENLRILPVLHFIRKLYDSHCSENNSSDVEAQLETSNE